MNMGQLPTEEVEVWVVWAAQQGPDASLPL